MPEEIWVTKWMKYKVGDRKDIKKVEINKEVKMALKRRDAGCSSSDFGDSD